MSNPEHLRKEDQIELNFESPDDKKSNGFSKKDYVPDGEQAEINFELSGIELKRDDLKKIIVTIIEENREEKKFRKSFAYRAIREYQSLFGGEKDRKKCFGYCRRMVEEIVSIIDEEIRPDDKHYSDELKEHLKVLVEEEEREGGNKKGILSPEDEEKFEKYKKDRPDLYE